MTTLRPRSRGDSSRIPLSVMDLVPVSEGMNSRDAIASTVEAARTAEQCGYLRYWVEESHGTSTAASSATTLLMGHVAANTETIRVGSGGIRMPNHSALHMAEELGTLNAMYPGRIDAGLGRASGTHPDVWKELVQTNSGDSGTSSQLEGVASQIEALMGYLSPGDIENTDAVIAFPGRGQEVPLFILGCTCNSAALAAQLGLPYAFMGQFSPLQAHPAMATYRENTDEPYVMAAANVLVADTEEEARFQLSTLYQMLAGIVTNRRERLKPPISDVDKQLAPTVLTHIKDCLEHTFVGTARQVVTGLQQFARRYGLDEIITITYAFDPEVRQRSIKSLGEAWNE